MFDNDHYYMASVIAELLAREGHAVTYVTTEGIVSWWSINTAEQARTHNRFAELGVTIIVNRAVTNLDANGVETACVYTDARAHVECAGLVLVTSREPNDALYQSIKDDAAFASLTAIGDCQRTRHHRASRLCGP